jgi:hypothetical protein
MRWVKDNAERRRELEMLRKFAPECAARRGIHTSSEKIRPMQWARFRSAYRGLPMARPLCSLKRTKRGRTVRSQLDSGRTEAKRQRAALSQELT